MRLKSQRHKKNYYVWEYETFFSALIFSKKSFESIIRFIDMCPADFDHNFAKPIDKNEFHSKAWLFENWLQGMEKEDLFSLLNSANYLIIKSLIDLLCAYIALRIKYMTNEEMADYFKI